MDIIFHYPPELTALLIDTIPRLCPRKDDVLLFFKGAGVEESMLADLRQRLRADRHSINKFEMVRTVLTRVNARGEPALGERREILKRVVEFDDFSTCWPKDQLEAKGLVTEIRRVTNVKDSFTRMSQEREAESRKRREEAAARANAIQAKKREMQAHREQLFALFAMKDAWSRGKKLETLLNQLFKASDILVRESFTITGNEAEGIVEQIDGVVEIDTHLYLVEVKWWAERLGPGDVAQHQVRVYHRGNARGIFISASGYTDPAIQSCRESLQKSTFVLAELEEVVRALEAEMALAEFFRKKIDAAILEKQPLKKIV